MKGGIGCGNQAGLIAGDQEAAVAPEVLEVHTDRRAGLVEDMPELIRVGNVEVENYQSEAKGVGDEKQQEAEVGNA